MDYHTAFDKAFAAPLKSMPDAKRWIAPGYPGYSQLIQRIKSRNPKDQMPPLATHYSDREAIEVSERWIKDMQTR